MKNAICVNAFIEEYTDLFGSLSALEEFEKAIQTYKPSVNELTVIQWLIQNMIGIRREMARRHHLNSLGLPAHLVNEQYELSVVWLLKHYITHSEIKLNPEEINCIITPQWLSLLFGPQFLKPPHIEKELDDHGTKD